MAAVLNPGGLVGRGGDYQARTPFYLGAALVGSLYIWWSAIQGIRRRDFTADIPVSIATAADLFVHQYSAAAVVAVLLLRARQLAGPTLASTRYCARPIPPPPSR